MFLPFIAKRTNAVKNAVRRVNEGKGRLKEVETGDAFPYIHSPLVSALHTSVC